MPTAKSAVGNLVAYLPSSSKRSTEPASEEFFSEKVHEIGLLSIQPEALTLGSKIGQGRFKTVYAGYHRERGPVAILRFEVGAEENEARMLGRLTQMDNSFLFIPEVFGAVEETSGNLLLAQEVSMLGSLKSILQEPDLVNLLTPAHKLHIAAQLAGAVDFLEAAGIVHTDIACRNALVFQLEDEPELTTVKLTDFGGAFALPPDADHIVQRQPQATRWCAPETVAHLQWSHKTDIWSLGACLWELFAGGVTPWMKCSKRADVAKRLRELSHCALGASVEIGDEFPAPARGMYPAVAHTAVLSCLRSDPIARPPAASIALVFEEIADVAEFFDGEIAKIDEGLEMVQVPKASGRPANQAPLPVHERSRPRKAHSPRSDSASPSQSSTVSPADTSRLRSAIASSEPASARSPAASARSVTQPASARSVTQPVGGEARCSSPAAQPSVGVWRQVSSTSCEENDDFGAAESAPRQGVVLSSRYETPTRTRRSSSASTAASVSCSALASTPSTMDTPPMRMCSSRPHEKGSLPPKMTVKHENHFDTLKGFLSSAEAAESVDSKQLKAMRQEIASAQVREAYWSGFTAGSDKQPERRTAQAPDSTMVLPLAPRGANSWGIQEQSSAHLQNGKWTLWSYVGPALRRQDFETEDDARAASKVANGGFGANPSMLRDPSGRQIEANSWWTTRA